MADLFNGTLTINFDGAQEWIQGTEYSFTAGSLSQVVTWKGITYAQYAPNSDPNASPDSLPSVWTPISPNVNPSQGIGFDPNGNIYLKIAGSNLSFDTSGNLIASGGSGGGVTSFNSYAGITTTSVGPGLNQTLQPNPEGGNVRYDLNLNNTYLNTVNGELTISNNNLVSLGGLVLSGQTGKSIVVNSTGDGFNLSTVSPVGSSEYLTASSKTGSSGNINISGTWQNLLDKMDVLTNLEYVPNLGYVLIAGETYQFSFKTFITDQTIGGSNFTIYFNVIDANTNLPLFPLDNGYLSTNNDLVPLSPFNYPYKPSTNQTVFIGIKGIGSASFPIISLSNSVFGIKVINANGGGISSGIQTFNGSSNPNPTLLNTSEILSVTDQTTGITQTAVGEIISDKIIVPTNIIPSVPSNNAIVGNYINYYDVGSNTDVPGVDIPYPEWVGSVIEVKTYVAFALYDVAKDVTEIFGIPTSPKYAQIQNAWLSIGGLNYTTANNCPWAPVGGQSPQNCANNIIAFLNLYPNFVGIDLDIEGGLASDLSIPAWITAFIPAVLAQKPNCLFSIVLADQLSAAVGVYNGWLPYQRSLISAMHTASGGSVSAGGKLAYVSPMVFDWGNVPMQEVNCNTNDPDGENSCVLFSVTAKINDLISFLGVTRDIATSLTAPIYMVGKHNGQPSDGIDDLGNQITDPWFTTNSINMFRDLGLLTVGAWCSNADCLPQPVTGQRWKYMTLYKEAISSDVPADFDLLTNVLINIYSRFVADKISYTNPAIPNINTVQKALDLALSASVIPDEELIIQSTSQTFDVPFTGIDTDISFQQNLAPASNFNLTLNIANYDGADANVTQKIFVANNTGFPISQFSVALVASSGAVIYNQNVSYANFNSLSAITCYLTWTGNIETGSGDYRIIADWSNGAVQQVNGITDIISSNNSNLISSEGIGNVDEIISSNNSNIVNAVGVGDVLSITSSTQSKIIRIL